MPELKTDMIDNILNEFLAEFDCTATMGSDFCYWPSKNLINYSVIAAAKDSDYFMENWHNLAPEMKIDPFLAALFHEVGHCMSEVMLTNEEELYSIDRRNQIAINLRALSAEDKEKERQYYYEYFALPEEALATNWAITYINTHQQKISAFWQKLQAAIMEFYKINNIETEAI